LAVAWALRHSGISDVSECIIEWLAKIRAEVRLAAPMSVPTSEEHRFAVGHTDVLVGGDCVSLGNAELSEEVLELWRLVPGQMNVKVLLKFPQLVLLLASLLLCGGAALRGSNERSEILDSFEYMSRALRGCGHWWWVCDVAVQVHTSKPRLLC